MIDALGRRQQGGSDGDGGDGGYGPPASVISYYQSLYGTTSDNGVSTTAQSTAQSTPDPNAVTITTSQSFGPTTADLNTAATSAAATASDVLATSTSPSPSAGTSVVAGSTLVSPSTNGGSTFQTSFTAASPPDTMTSSSAAANASPYAETQHARHHGGLSGGALAAAILVPVLVALALLLLAFFCLRRRRKDSRPVRERIPAMQEKSGSWRHSGLSRRSVASAPGEMPIVLRENNNAYFTGLDTSSQGSRSVRDGSGEYYAPRTSESGAFLDPPPPYKAKSLVSARSHSTLGSTAPAAISTLPQLREPEPLEPIELSPFSDPDSTPSSPQGTPPASQGSSSLGVATAATTNLNRLLTTPSPARPGTSRSRTGTVRSARSITSTLYSDTASIHSARAARRSVGGAQVIRTSLGGSLQGILVNLDDLRNIRTTGEDDPFNDPESPVSSISGFQTPLQERMASPVSEFDADHTPRPSMS